MIAQIKSDFDVEMIEDGNTMSFFAAHKNLLFHFVFLHKGAYNEIDQLYLPRFEIANWLCRYFKGEGEAMLNISSMGIVLEIKMGSDIAEKIKDQRYTLDITIKNETVQVGINDTPFGKSLLKDVDLLTKVYKAAQGKEFRTTVLKTIVEDFSETANYETSDGSLIQVAFEQKLMKSTKNWRYHSVISKLIKMEHETPSDAEPHLWGDIMVAMPLVAIEKSCDCGSDTCFFELLNAAFTTFFKAADVLFNGTVDEEKVNLEFERIWRELTIKQKVLLTYLDHEFSNTPLLNLYLLIPDCDIQEYLYKMTYPYQPDSDDDYAVRSSVSWVAAWLRM
jgi:hypothetical protein